MKKNKKDKFVNTLWRVLPSHKEWIEKKAREEGLSEAGIIRGLINVAMRKDK